MRLHVHDNTTALRSSGHAEWFLGCAFFHPNPPPQPTSTEGLRRFSMQVKVIFDWSFYFLFSLSFSISRKKPCVHFPTWDAYQHVRLGCMRPLTVVFIKNRSKNILTRAQAEKRSQHLKLSIYVSATDL